MHATLNWLTDPTVFQVNRLDAHSDHVCYASEAEMAQNQTSLRQSLDGIWKLRWSASPALRPAAFWEKGADLSGFDEVRVPGHLELQGYDRIQYINTLYPWDGHSELRPPEIDWDRTPVASYVREFTLDAGLTGKRVCISFQGVERAFYVWLNGHFVGYAEDSFTPSDFELTPYLEAGTNRLCVEVYKHSSASWLEDQDFFRFSGMFRSVFLYAKPDVHVDDLWFRPELAEDNRSGSLTIRLRTSGALSGVHCRISHPEQGTLYDGELPLHGENGTFWSEKLDFSEVRPWNYGTPELYHVVLSVLNAAGAVTEWIPYDIGFRRMELRNKLMLLNGERLVIRGVNRHEWNPSTGRAICREDMERAMEVILRNNINAVRTCHYPNQTEWYHLCDQNGIYLMDETNLESHGTWQRNGGIDASWNVPGSLPEWKDCVVDRARSMFERDKNHVSILFWSCGNESYAGEDIRAMAEFFRSSDPSRLVHYEGVFNCRAFEDCSDMESQMYTSPENIRAYLENNPPKPMILCEYMHDMGNSIGGMESYIRLTEEFPMYQGGFIWDYMDQALWQENARGERTLGYGGDFEDRQSDYAFSGNGIVFADGTEKPAMQDVRYWYSSAEERARLDAENAAAAAAFVPQAHGSASGKLSLCHGDGAFGVRGDGFEVLFSLYRGGPVSLRSQGREWLWRAPQPALWRAPTENDLGCRFDRTSAVWQAAESFCTAGAAEILSESPDQAVIRYRFGSPVMTDLEIELTYTVHADGAMDVCCHYHGADGRPDLPEFGLRFETTRPVARTVWTGLSGETYPDRKKGASFGTFTETPHVPDYLVPQECGHHTDTHAFALETEEGEQLRFVRANRPFGFSAIPYTPLQLREAQHKWELPQPCRTVVTLTEAMRGVGGIDSWYSDVEKPYRIPADRDLELNFRILLA